MSCYNKYWNFSQKTIAQNELSSLLHASVKQIVIAQVILSCTAGSLSGEP